jgi:hypothetical protein
MGDVPPIEVERELSSFASGNVNSNKPYSQASKGSVTEITGESTSYAGQREARLLTSTRQQAFDTHNRCAGVIGLCGGEAEDCWRLAEIARTLTMLDGGISR